MFTCAQREGQDGNGCGFVGAIREDTGIADVKIRNIMGTAETVRDKFLRIVAHAKGTGFVEAGAGNINLASSQVFAATGAYELFGGVFGVLPHEESVFVPGKVEAGGRNAVDV